MMKYSAYILLACATAILAQDVEVQQTVQVEPVVSQNEGFPSLFQRLAFNPTTAPARPTTRFSTFAPFTFPTRQQGVAGTTKYTFKPFTFATRAPGFPSLRFSQPTTKFVYLPPKEERNTHYEPSTTPYEYSTTYEPSTTPYEYSTTYEPSTTPFESSTTYEPTTTPYESTTAAYEYTTYEPTTTQKLSPRFAFRGSVPQAKYVSSTTAPEYLPPKKSFFYSKPAFSFFN